MPFIETAYLGSAGADVFRDGDGFQHCGAIRINVKGSGNLIPTLYNMQEVNSELLETIVMADPTPNVAESLANFIQERMSLRLETTEINEIFRITRITFFLKPIWASGPR